MNTKSRRRGFAVQAPGSVPELPAANPPAGYRARSAHAPAVAHAPIPDFEDEPGVAIGQASALMLLQVVLKARTLLRAQLAHAPTEALRAELRQAEQAVELLSKALVSST